MTVIEILNRVDELKPNTFPQKMKENWLMELEAKALRLMSQYEEEIPEAELHMDDAEIYVLWLFAMIDFHNEEYEKYNNSMAMFQTAYSEFERRYNRTHTHRQTRNVYF